MAIDLATFVARHVELLQQERDAELAEVRALLATRSEAELEARGVTLRRLAVADLEPGFGGGLHAVLQPSRGGPLPAHRFGPGDVVALMAPDQARAAAVGVQGVVARIAEDAITIALDDDEVDLPPLVRLDRLAPDVTFRRLVAALQDLQQQRRGDPARLREVCFELREPEFAPAPAAAPAWFDPTLDATQRQAVLHALAAQQLALIHGPPGTGKTTAVVEVIRQAVAQRQRVLACAPSNVAVDNLAERLLRAGVRAVRLGHPARMLASVQEHSLAALVDAAGEQKIRRDLRRELHEQQRRLGKAKSRAERNQLRNGLRALRREQRDLDHAITAGILDGADVVLATTTGAADRLLAERTFELVVIDEAAQALEAACWIPLQRGRRAVLAGDHRQLPPTILSAAAATGGLARTLFERLAEGPRGEAITRMLTVQYRMHATIMAWSSSTLYGGRLEAAASVRAHRLADLPGVVATAATTEAMLFLDTAGCGHDESPGDEEGSKANAGEAALVVRHVRGLLEAGVAAADIGVITPYNAQVQLLRSQLAVPGLEIGTVDGLQGREKEAVVISLVRSNEQGEVGFLADLRRLNVALTRARRHLCVVGDSATLSHDRDLAGFVAHCQAHATWRSAFELG
ncbi:MAG TPA: IGHMBP2 family helicase [Planctomycetota bacterium]|nr:IGHMBP2 family helicase [Planctomycetota bacterium]